MNTPRLTKHARKFYQAFWMEAVLVAMSHFLDQPVRPADLFTLVEAYRAIAARQTERSMTRVKVHEALRDLAAEGAIEQLPDRRWHLTRQFRQAAARNR